MKKTSIYLDDVDRQRIRRMAAQQGKSQAEIIRAAIGVYEQHLAPVRNFTMMGSFEGTGRSIADRPEDELFAGFGE
jgi:hypothetical protein